MFAERPSNYFFQLFHTLSSCADKEGSNLCPNFVGNKASQAIQSPRTVPFFLLVSLLDGYSFPNVLVKNIVAFKH